ncbi:MAG: hypothetical protein J3K34DRAFT_382377, partial [Monoraphidium minutum]
YIEVQRITCKALAVQITFEFASRAPSSLQLSLFALLRGSQVHLVAAQSLLLASDAFACSTPARRGGAHPDASAARAPAAPSVRRERRPAGAVPSSPCAEVAAAARSPSSLSRSALPPPAAAAWRQQRSVRSAPAGAAAQRAARRGADCST